MITWISVEERLPKHGEPVLATYTVYGFNRRVIIVGIYFEKFKEESLGDDDNDEYNEEDDTYYVCEGWYEQQRNWGDYSSILVHEGEVTHWAHLPEGPK